MKLWCDESWLRARYLEDGLSTHQIAGIAGCSHVLVLRYMKRFDIATRDRIESVELRWGHINLYKNKEWLREQISTGSSCGQIASECGVCSSTIHTWCKKLGVTTDYAVIEPAWLWNQYYGECLSVSEIANLAGVSTFKVRKLLQKYGFYDSKRAVRPTEESLLFLYKQLGSKKAVGDYLGVSLDWWRVPDNSPGELRNRGWLYKNYVIQERSAAQISEQLNCDARTVLRSLKKYGIQVRTKKEAQKICGRQFRGKKNPGYIDGRHDIPYNTSFKKVISPQILERDNHTCQICRNTKRTMHCHHIDFDKTNDSDCNLITLCINCHHGKAHGRDKIEWQAALTEYQMLRFWQEENPHLL